MFKNMDVDSCLLLCVLQVVGTFHGAFLKWVPPWAKEDSLEVSELQTMHVQWYGVVCACAWMSSGVFVHACIYSG